MSHLRFSDDDFDAYDAYVKGIQACIIQKLRYVYGISRLNLIAGDVEYEDVSETEKRVETSNNE